MTRTLFGNIAEEVIRDLKRTVWGSYVYWCELCIVGYCFQFNKDGSHKSSVAGERGGMVLMLNTGIDEYTVSDRAGEGFNVS